MRIILGCKTEMPVMGIAVSGLLQRAQYGHTDGFLFGLPFYLVQYILDGFRMISEPDCSLADNALKPDRYSLRLVA